MPPTQNATTLGQFLSTDTTAALEKRRSRLQHLLLTSAATFEARERIESYTVQIDFELMERVAVQEPETGRWH
ncbi:hypothetical protein [Polaromonas naphthalenivorans]|uniref:hypothetical protein n=1 Tax=Polaromonas naphthalenivorans TaxID=216465 RepID=UPI0002D74ACF|nr:hypothetical protein [Polaromonas naphthalenivorans]